MMCNWFFFPPFAIGYVCNLFTRQLILDNFCSYGWQESFGVMTSVCVSLYIGNSSFVFLRCIVRFRKLMELSCSFSMVNFILVCWLLNSVKVSSIFVFFLIVNYKNIVNVSKVFGDRTELLSI
jgi:hypothetical protein